METTEIPKFIINKNNNIIYNSVRLVRTDDYGRRCKLNIVQGWQIFEDQHKIKKIKDGAIALRGTDHTV